MYDYVILNGTIVTSRESYPGNIYVKNEKIAAITGSEEVFEAVQTYDAKGKLVFAGFIDTHVHSRDGGALHKEDFYHSTMSAACGGITTLLEMPNAVPAVVNAESFRKQHENLSSKAFIDFGMWALNIGDLNNADLQELNELGVVGYKFFWGYAIRKDNYNLIYNPKSTNKEVIPPLGDGEVYRIFQAVAKTGKEIAIHAENADLIRELTGTIDVSSYKNPYEALLAQRPVLAEVTTVQLAISFAKATGAHLHVLHVSAAETVDLIQKAQSEGIWVTAETCPHYLFLTSERFEEVGNMMKGYPPVRKQTDQDRLWKGLLEGTLNHVCSDHAPHTKEEKMGTLSAIPAGMCAVETMIPLMLTAVNEGKLSKEQLAAVMSENPAKHYGLWPGKGSLQIGTDADIVVVDMDEEWVVDVNKLHSVSKVTAYDGFTIKGRPEAVFLRGKLIAQGGEPVVETPFGKYVVSK